MFKLAPFLLCLTVLIASMVRAEELKSDMVADLIPINERIVDIHLSADGTSLMVALSSEVVKFQLFPVREIDRVNVDFDIRAIDLSPEGDVLVAGNRRASSVQIRSNDGYLQFLRQDDKSKRLEKWYRGTFTGSDLFSDVTIGRNGTFAVANLTSSSAVFGHIRLFQDDKNALNPIFDGQWLPCGTPIQISVFGPEKKPVLISSVFGDRLIGLSYLDGRFSKGCQIALKVQGSSRVGQLPYTLHRLLLPHKRFENKASDDSYLASLVYADNSAEGIAIVDLYDRFGVVDYDRPSRLPIAKLVGGFNHKGDSLSLGADTEGRLVVLGGNNDSRLLIFTVEEFGLDYRHWLEATAPVILVDVSGNGEVVAFLTKSGKGRRIHVLRGLDATRVQRHLPPARFTVKWLQQALADRKLDPGPFDGKLGPRTQNAVKQFLGNDSLSLTDEEAVLRAVSAILNEAK